MPHSGNRGASQSNARAAAALPGADGAALATPHDSTHELATLLAHLRGMAYRCRADARCTVLFVSAGCRELLGYPPEAFFGEAALNYDLLVHPDDRESVRGRMDAALAERRGYELRYRIRTAAGDMKWVSDRGRGIYAPGGTLETIEGFVSDVTELKRIEGSLREHDDMLTLAFQNARDMMLLARVEPGSIFRVQSVNRRYVEVVRAAGYDLTVERIVGLTFSELRALFAFPDEVWDPLMKRYRLVIETRQPLHYDEVTETPHGTYYGASTISPILDEGGTCRFVLYASNDTTERRRAENALRESEEKFAKAFRASPGAMAIGEPDGRGFIEVNDGYTRMLGYPREELLGRRSVELNLWVNPAERAAFHEALRRDGVVRDMEVLRRRRDGRQIVCLLSAEPLELGGRHCVVTSLYDITDRKRAELAVRESEERFSKAFRAVPDAVFITELASGRVVDVNEGCTRIYGYSRDECVGRTTHELNIWFNPADRGRLMRILQESGGLARDLEIPGRRRDGSRVDVMVSCETIELNGRPHLVTIAHDITARKAAHQALRESEAKFAKAFHASPGGMAISDLSTRQFLEVSDGYARVFGYKREEMIGRTGVDLGLWAHEADRLQFIADLTGGESVRDREVEARRRDGTPVFVVISAELIELGGRTCGITALYDVSSRRRAEEERTKLEAQLRQAQKLDALGRLAGGIAHDFNNILTGIGAYTELALMDAERVTEVRKHLAQVSSATQRAADLVRQILTFSRQTPQERKPTRLQPVVREALKLLRSSLPKMIEIVERIDPAAPVVLADTTQIHQVVMNLCTNGAHAIRDRRGRLEVSLDRFVADETTLRERADLEPGTYARLMVRDNGHGMDAATISRIFEPFFTTKAPGEGTGLGLAVVHGIVEEHDGVITVQSRVDEGTTFELCFPEQAELVAATLTGQEGLPPGRGQRLLLVDDEVSIATAAAELLRRIGYQVSALSDPRVAWTLFAASPDQFDAVVTDLTMPHLTGVELARRLLQRRPGLPVLLASGHTGIWTSEGLRAIGVRGLITKPLNAPKLARALHEIFGAPPVKQP